MRTVRSSHICLHRGLLCCSFSSLFSHHFPSTFILPLHFTEPVLSRPLHPGFSLSVFHLCLHPRRMTSAARPPRTAQIHTWIQLLKGLALKRRSGCWTVHSVKQEARWSARDRCWRRRVTGPDKAGHGLWERTATPPSG